MKNKCKAQKLFSSNAEYVIWKYEDSNVIKLYAGYPTSSLYGLAETIYNDCIKSLNIPTPLICEVVFYHRRNMVYTFIIPNCQSVEDVLKEICKKFCL